MSEMSGSEDEYELMEEPDKMTYTEQANKRTHCSRLTSFIRLADYLIVNTMHVLVVNSVEVLLNFLTEQVCYFVACILKRLYINLFSPECRITTKIT